MKLNHKIARLEVKNADAIKALAEEERQKKIDVREQWRKENRERIRWQMFLSLWGPDSDWYTYEPDPEDPGSVAEVIAQIAYSEKFREILKHYNGHLVDYSKMNGFDGAFAFAIEAFYAEFDDFDLLTRYLSSFSSDYMPANTPLADLAAKKIAECGLEWLQIAYSDRTQNQLEEQAFGSWISKDFMMWWKR